MTKFVASQAVRMNSVGDLAYISFTENTANWNSDLHSFTVANDAGTVIIHAEGVFLGGPGQKPTIGTITKLTVEYGAGNHAYTISDFPAVSFTTFEYMIGSSGPQNALASLFPNADIITGSGGDDLLQGHAGKDTISGLGGDDEINGGSGNDDLRGGGGDDRLNGVAGDDALRGGSGKDILNGGGGSDTALYSEKNTSVEVVLNGGSNVQVKVNGVHEDTIKNIEHVTGGEGNDKLTGDAQANTFLGGGGHDELAGGGNKDVLSGEGGQDNLAGGSGDDKLNGGSGDDTLAGGADNDKLDGAAGNDTLSGNGGADTFYFRGTLDADTNVDTISDFEIGVDKLLLFRSTFTAISEAEAVAGSYFAINSAKDANDHIIYEAASGELLYDADGTGAIGAVLFAQVTPNTVLSVDDIIAA